MDIFLIILGVALVVIFIVALSTALFTYDKRTPEEKGKEGELLASKYLDIYSDYGINISNIIFSDKSGSHQIDHIFISQTGIYVIETKNYSGRIYGNYKQKYWTQVLAYGNSKSRLYNPIKQNYSHIYALSRLLNVKTSNFISIVVFIDCELEINSGGALVCPNIRQFSGLLNHLLNTREHVFSDEEFKRCHRALMDLKEHEMLTEEEHIKNIQTKKQAVKDGICPLCGGKLILRNGKYGPFYGCSNYPKCRYKKR